MRENTRIVLASRPTGAPTQTDFMLESAPLEEPADGEVLLRTIYISLDPYIRGRLGPGLTYGSSAPHVALGDTIPGGTVSEVLESRDTRFRQGDFVLSSGGWQAHSAQSGDSLRLLDPTTAPISTALGVLGMPGFTAYVGLHLVGRVQAGETVAVAAASGPVGSMVGQMARLERARTIGIAGGPAKVGWLTDIGFDVALDHRMSEFPTNLSAAVPDGIDLYFENVGGRVLDAVTPHLAPHARVPVCGLVGDYNGTKGQIGRDRLSAFMSAVLSRFVMVQGFTFAPFVADHQAEFLRKATRWLASGELQYLEDVTDGLRNAPEAFIGMLGGSNFGKALVRVAPDPTAPTLRPSPQHR